MSDDATPTQRLETVPTTVVPAARARVATPLLIALLSVGGLLLVGVGLIIGMLLGRNDQPVAAAPSPTASEAPASTPPSEPAQAPVQQAPALRSAEFTLFSTVDEVTCGPGDWPKIELEWDTKHAVSAWMWINGDDAVGSMQIPLYGTEADLPTDFTFPCDQTEVTPLMTLVGEDGQHVTRKWTITNIGEVDQ